MPLLTETEKHSLVRDEASENILPCLGLPLLRVYSWLYTTMNKKIQGRSVNVYNGLLSTKTMSTLITRAPNCEVCSVIRFLCTKSESSHSIHRKLIHVYV